MSRESARDIFMDRKFINRKFSTYYIHKVMFFFSFSVQEGLSLVKHGVSPYSGDVVHEVRFENIVMLRVLAQRK